MDTNHTHNLTQTERLELQIYKELKRINQR